MFRILCRFVLGGLVLALASPARAQDEDPPGSEPATVAADPVPDSRVHLVRETGGHAAVPRVLLFTPDGKKLLSTGDDRTVQVWDVLTRERLRVIRPPTGADGQGSVPDQLVVDRKGERVAFWVEVKGDQGRTVRTTFVCSLETGQAQALPGGGMLAFAPDGKALAVGDGHEVRLVDVATDRPLHTATPLSKKGNHKVRSIAFSPDGSTLAVVTGEPTVYLLDAATLRHRGKWTVAGAGHSLRSVGWADDRTLVCRSAHKDKELVVLDAGTGVVKRSYRQKALASQLPRGTDAKLLELHALPRTTKVLVLMANKKTGEVDEWANVSSLFDWVTGEASKAFLVRSPYGCAATAVAPDLTLAAQGDGDLNDVVLWDPTEGKEVGRLRAAVRGANGRQSSVRWRPDGKAVAWENLEDRPGRGWAELDLTTLVLTTRKPEDLTTYQRGILREWGPLRLKAKNQRLEVTGGPQPVRCPVGGAVEGDYTFVAGGRVATDSHNSPVLQVLDSATGRKLYAPRVAQSYIQSLAVSPRPECRYVLVGSADQTLTVYNPATGKLLLTVFPAGQDWIAWTPEGYYAATPGGERLMGWTVDNGPDKLASFYSAERFRKHFYRPEVIELVLEKGSVEEALKGAKVEAADFEKLLPPRATLRVLDRTQLPRVKLQVTAEAGAREQPVQSLELRVDGRPLADSRQGKGLEELPAGQARVEVVWDVELPPGPHELKVLARGPDTAGASEAVAVNVPQPVKERPTLHLLAVGIDAYQDKALRLKFAVKDATDLDDAFQKNCAGDGNLFGAVRGDPLLNDKATRQAVLGALQGVRQAARPGDLLVVYFAGHGVQAGNDFYLLPVEADTTKLSQTALSGTELRQKLADMPCQVLLILDACHSAAGVQAFKPATDDAARQLSGDECGVAVFCAAMGREYALEAKGNGLFTRALVEALRRTSDVPYNHYDHRQYVQHLHAFVFDEVQKASEDRQHPFLSLPWVTQPFAVRRLPEPSPGAR